jgi:hypothetical protein
VESLYHLFLKPPLHAICMLALAGHLTEQQKQGVVVLLGGGSSTSNIDSTSSMGAVAGANAAVTASCLPIPEPSSLAQARQEAGVSLQDLAMALLRPPDVDPSPGITAELHYVLLPFGADKLPWLALVVEVEARKADPESQQQQQQAELSGARCHQDTESLHEESMRQYHELKDRADRAYALITEPRMQYLKWLRGSMLKVIDDVLSRSASQ